MWENEIFAQVKIHFQMQKEDYDSDFWKEKFLKTLPHLFGKKKVRKYYRAS